MSTLKQILEKRGMLLCSGCGMQMRPQQGACPDCGVSYGFGMGAKDASDMSEAKTEEEPTTDFKLDKAGRKIKASKIIFNKGEDDSTKKVQEDMKTTYKDFMETIYANEELKGDQHKIDKNKNGKVDKHDFKLLRKEDTTEEAAQDMKEGSFYGNDKMAKAAQDIGDSKSIVRMRDAKGTYTATMVRKQGEKNHKEISRVYDKKDVKEEVEELDELSVNTLSSYGKKAGRSIDRKLDQAADHSKKATNLYDRGTASAVDKAYDHEGKSNNLHKQVNKRNASMDQAAGKLKNKMSKGVAEEVDEGEVPEHMKGKQKPYVSSNSKGDYEVLGNQGQVKATFSRKEHGNDARSMARAHVQKHYDTYLKEEDMNEDLHPDAGKVLKHIKPEHHAKYTPDMTTKHYTGNFADRRAVLSAAEKAGHLKEASPFDWKNTPRQTSDKTKTSTYHDVKKISTGTVYTKQFDKDGTSKGTGDDAAKKAEGAAKRGRGRPKKDKFAESVEMLLSLSEDQFDSMMEEGFDAFFEAYEELDELSKTTLGDYAKKASREATINRKIASDFEHMSDRSRTPGMKQAAGVNAQNYKERSWKRRDGAEKAIDKLTK